MKMNKEHYRLVVNMIASIVTLIINLGINFLLTKYIVSKIGSEAYGFVNLANSIVNYATIVTVALNSVAGRFITISYHRGNKEEANQYFNSVLYANLILGLILAIVGIFIIFNLESLIHIPNNLIISVKQLFTFVFLNFILSIISTLFTVATFITNRIYIGSVINAISCILKAILFYVLFSVLPTSVAIVGLVSIICTIFILFANIYFTKTLIPDIHIRFKNFSITKIKTLLSAGIWNSVTNLSQFLSDGLDLLVSNLLVSALAVGQLSIAKTLCSVLNVVVGSVSNLFTPQLTYYYAKKDMDNLITELKSNMLVNSMFANVPFCLLIVFGKQLLELWVPSQDINKIYILLVLTVMHFFITPPINCLFNIFLITNNLRKNSLYWLGVGILNLVIVLALLKTTLLGVFAVAGVSTITGIVSCLTFVPIHGARCLNQRKSIFYPIIFRYLFVTVLILIVFVIISISMVMTNSWINISIKACVSSLVGFLINYLFLFGKNEKSKFNALVKNKLWKKEN